MYKLEQKSTIKNIKTLYGSWEKALKLFDDYTKIVFMAKHRSIHGERCKILTPTQML